ncbi:putative LL-diaminopimelate aminotransferase [Helianthus anomalus]
MDVTEDRLIMVEFVVIQKHVFILFISNSYRKEIQGTVKFVNLGFVICEIEISFFGVESVGSGDGRPSEKGSRPTVFRRTPTFPTIAVMKNQAVATICGLITGIQLHICIPTVVWFVGTNGNNDADLARTKRFNKSTPAFAFFTLESYGLYEVEQSGKQLRAQLASWFYTIIDIEEDGIFVSNGAQFHISCLQVFVGFTFSLKLQWPRKIHHDSYMVTFRLIVLVVRASMVRQLLLKPVAFMPFF